MFVQKGGLDKLRELIKSELYPTIFARRANADQCQAILLLVVQLLQEFPLTPAVLVESKIGKAVNKVLKSANSFDSQIVRLVTPLVAKWKGIVKEFKLSQGWSEETRSFNINKSDSNMSSVLDIN